MSFITDPADRLTDEFVRALTNRYSGSIPPIRNNLDEFADRYANVCDLVVQLLWAERYGTDVDDPYHHTSEPARRIAALICEAVGLTPDDTRRQ